MNDIIKIDLNLPRNICPCCLGTGKIKAMQMATAYGGITVRGKDTITKCSNCKGVGLINK